MTNNSQLSSVSSLLSINSSTSDSSLDLNSEDSRDLSWSPTALEVISVSATPSPIGGEWERTLEKLSELTAKKGVIQDLDGAFDRVLSQIKEPLSLEKSSYRMLALMYEGDEEALSSDSEDETYIKSSEAYTYAPQESLAAAFDLEEEEWV